MKFHMRKVIVLLSEQFCLPISSNKRSCTALMSMDVFNKKRSTKKPINYGIPFARIHREESIRSKIFLAVKKSGNSRG